MQPLRKDEETAATPNPLVKSILKTIYIAHLVLSIIYATFILITDPNVKSFPITFTMLIIYGYMGVWIFIIGFLLVLCKSHERATIFSRIFVKLVIFCFPIFGLLSLSKDQELNNHAVHLFIIYMGLVTLLLIVYELVCCICYEDKHPSFLFVENDLNEANSEVLRKRKQYNDLISSL